MSGTISFNYFPGAANWRVPGIFVETNANINNVSGSGPTLILGLKGMGGTATNNMPVLAVNQANVNALVGQSSMLALIYAQYIKCDPNATVYIAPIVPGMLTSQVQTITVTGPATNNGNIALYVAGVSVPIAVTNGQTATVIGNAIAAAITANPYIPCSATATAGVVTVTTQAGGVTAGDIDIRVNYYGPSNGEVLPSGVTIAVAQTVPPAGDPTIANLLSNLNGMGFDYIVNPFIGSANTGLLTTYLAEATGTWSPLSKLYGQSFTAIRDTVTQAVTYGTALNDQFQNFIAFNNAPQPQYIWTAAFAGVCAASLRVNPALTLTGLDMNLLPPPAGQSFAKNDRNTLLYSGIGTFRTQGGRVLLERARTSYSTNPVTGVPDISWLDTETPATLTAIERAFIDQLGTQFARKILVADGTPLSNANNYVTSQVIKAAAINIYQTLCNQGLCQNYEYFKNNALAQNAGLGQVSLYLPVDVANQLRTLAINVTFSKS